MWGFWRQNDDPYTDPTFVFDVIDSESMDLTVDWSKHAIERDGDAALYGRTEPVTVSLSGLISPTVLGDDYDPQHVRQAIATLETLAEERQPLVVVSTWWARTDLALSRVSAEYSHTDGEHITSQLELVSVRTVDPDTVDMPLARLRKGRHRRRGGQKKKGGGGKKDAEPSLLDKGRAILGSADPYGALVDAVMGG